MNLDNLNSTYGNTISLLENAFGYDSQQVKDFRNRFKDVDSFKKYLLTEEGRQRTFQNLSAIDPNFVNRFKGDEVMFNNYLGLTSDGTDLDFDVIGRGDDYQPLSREAEQEENSWLSSPFQGKTDAELSDEIERLHQMQADNKKRNEQLNEEKKEKSFMARLADAMRYSSTEAGAMGAGEAPVPEYEKLDPRVTERLNRLERERSWREQNKGEVRNRILELDRRLQDIEPDNGTTMASARYLLNRSKDLYNAPSMYGKQSGTSNWWQGLSDQLSQYDTWTAGVTELWRMGHLNNIVNKMNKGEELTPQEEALLDSYMTYAAVSDLRNNNLALGYEIGQGAAQSIPFMAEMFLTAGAGAAAKTGLVKIAERAAGKAFAEKFARALGGAMTRQAGKWVETGATKTLGGKIGKQLVYDHLQTAFMPSTYSGILDDRLHSILVEDKDWGLLDIIKNFEDAVVETGTENWGGKLFDLGVGKAGAKFAKKFGGAKLPFSSKIWGENKWLGGLTDDFIASPLGETAEEYIGGLVNYVRGLNPVYLEYRPEDAQELRGEIGDMLSGEGFWQTFATVLPMSLLGGSGKMIKSGVWTKKYNDSRNDLITLLQESGANVEQANNIVKQIEGSTNDTDFLNKLMETTNILKMNYESNHMESDPARVKEYVDNIDKVLGKYAKSAIIYNQQIGDIRAAYGKLSPEEKKDVDEVLDAFIEGKLKEMAKKFIDKALEEQEAETTAEEATVSEAQPEAQPEAPASEQVQEQPVEQEQAEEPVAEPVSQEPVSEEQAAVTAEEERLNQVYEGLEGRVAKSGTKAIQQFSPEEKFIWTMRRDGMEAAVEDAVGFLQDAQSIKDRTQRRTEISEWTRIINQYAPQALQQAPAEDTPVAPVQEPVAKPEPVEPVTAQEPTPVQEEQAASPVVETTAQPVAPEPAEAPAAEQPKKEKKSKKKEEKQEPEHQPVNVEQDDVHLVMNSNDYHLAYKSKDGKYVTTTGKVLKGQTKEYPKNYAYRKEKDANGNDKYVKYLIMSRTTPSGFANGFGVNKGYVNVVNTETGQPTKIRAKELSWKGTDKEGKVIYTPLKKSSEENREERNKKFYNLKKNAKSIDDALNYVIGSYEVINEDGSKQTIDVTLEDIIESAYRQEQNNSKKTVRRILDTKDLISKWEAKANARAENVNEKLRSEWRNGVNEAIEIWNAVVKKMGLDNILEKHPSVDYGTDYSKLRTLLAPFGDIKGKPTFIANIAQDARNLDQKLANPLRKIALGLEMIEMMRKKGWLQEQEQPAAEEVIEEPVSVEEAPTIEEAPVTETPVDEELENEIEETENLEENIDDESWQPAEAITNQAVQREAEAAQEARQAEQARVSDAKAQVLAGFTKPQQKVANEFFPKKDDWSVKELAEACVREGLSPEQGADIAHWLDRNFVRPESLDRLMRDVVRRNTETQIGQAPKPIETPEQQLVSDVVIGKLRKLLGDKLHTDLTQDEAKEMLRFLEDGEPQIAYHGTTAKFDRFDHKFMGSGEGLQAFGWGTYVTKRKGIAVSYANQDFQRKSSPNISKEDRTALKYIRALMVGGVDNVLDKLYSDRNASVEKAISISANIMNKIPYIRDKFEKHHSLGVLPYKYIFLELDDIINDVMDMDKKISDFGMDENQFEYARAAYDLLGSEMAFVKMYERCIDWLYNIGYDVREVQLSAIDKLLVSPQIYTVEIPDDATFTEGGKQYFPWDKEIDREELARLYKEAFEGDLITFADYETALKNSRLKTYGDVYDDIAECIDSNTTYRRRALAVSSLLVDGKKTDMRGLQEIISSEVGFSDDERIEAKNNIDVVTSYILSGIGDGMSYKDAIESVYKFYYNKNFKDRIFGWLRDNIDRVHMDIPEYDSPQKQTSKFLQSLGYVGVRVPQYYFSGSANALSANDYNYVIFDENNLNILNRIERMKTPEGTIYGWAVGDEIYLTQDGMNMESPIHEYTHLWAKAIEKSNPKAWAKIVKLCQDNKVLWDAVINDPNYESIKDDPNRVASEVLARYSGKRGAERMEAEAAKILAEGDTFENQTQANLLVSRMKKALQEFWGWIADKLGLKYQNIEEVADRILYDLLNEEDISKEIQDLTEKERIAEAQIDITDIEDLKYGVREELAKEEKKAQRKQEKAKDRPKLVAQELTELEKMTFRVADRGEGLRVLQARMNEELKKRGLPLIDAAHDIRSLLERSGAGAAGKIDVMEKTSLKRFYKTIQDVAELLGKSELYKKYRYEKWVDPEDGVEKTRELTPVEFLSRYLLACDDIERIKKGREPRGVGVFFLRTKSGMDQFVKEVQAELDPKTLIELHSAVKEISNISINALKEGQLIDDADYDEYMARNFYVPERDFEDDTDAEVDEEKAKSLWEKIKKGLHTLDERAGVRRDVGAGAITPLATAFRAKGGESLASNVLENLVRNAYDSIEKAEENKVRLAMYNLLKSNPEVTNAVGIAIPKEVYYTVNEEGKIVKTETPESKLDRKQQAAAWTLDNVNKDEKVKVYVNGVLNEMDFSGLVQVADALNNKRNTTNDMPEIRNFCNLMASVCTTYNPAFFAVNIARDVPFVITKGYIEYGLGFVPQFNKEMLNPENMKAIFNFITGNIPDDFENTDFGRFIYGGGQTGYTKLPEVIEVRRKIDKLRAQGKLTIAPALDLFSGINEFSELWTRFSAYKAVLDLGKSEDEALRAAKNLSVNFNRRGFGDKFVNLFNNLSMFANASIQGAMGFYRAFGNPLDGDTENRARNILRATTALMIAPMLLGVLTTLVSPDDRDKEYVPSEWDRCNYFILGNFRVPISEQMRPFWTLGVAAVMVGRGDWSISQGLSNISESFVSNLIPFSPVLTNGAAELVRKGYGKNDKSLTRVVSELFIPQGMRSISDLANGETFMGSTLTNERTRDNLPQFMFGETQSKFCQDVAYAFYIMGGGDPNVRDTSSMRWGEADMSGWDINPKEIDAIMSFLPSGVKDVVYTLYGVGRSAVTGESVEDNVRLKDIPVVNRFARTNSPQNYRLSVVRAASQEIAEYDKKMTTYKKQAEQGNMDAARKIMELQREDGVYIEKLRQQVDQYKSVSAYYRAKKEGLMLREYEAKYPMLVGGNYEELEKKFIYDLYGTMSEEEGLEWVIEKTSN